MFDYVNTMHSTADCDDGVPTALFAAFLFLSRLVSTISRSICPGNWLA